MPCSLLSHDWLSFQPNLFFSLSSPELLKKFCSMSWAVCHPTNSSFSWMHKYFSHWIGLPKYGFFWLIFLPASGWHGWIESDRIWKLSRRGTESCLDAGGKLYQAITGKSWRSQSLIGKTQAFTGGVCLWEQSGGLKLMDLRHLPNNSLFSWTWSSPREGQQEH